MCLLVKKFREELRQQREEKLGGGSKKKHKKEVVLVKHLATQTLAAFPLSEEVQEEAFSCEEQEQGECLFLPPLL